MKILILLVLLALTGCRTTDNGEQQMEYSRVIPGFGNTLPETR